MLLPKKIELPFKPKYFAIKLLILGITLSLIVISSLYLYSKYPFTLSKAQTIPPVVFPDENGWQSKTPAEVNVSDLKLNEFVNILTKNGTMTQPTSNGVIIKDGYLIKTWGDPDYQFEWASAMKPVMSNLLFYAIETVQDGKINTGNGVNTLVKDYWLDSQGQTRLTPEDQTMTFAHFANMTSGYARGENPGEAWAYNDYAITLYCYTLKKIYDPILQDPATTLTQFKNSPALRTAAANLFSPLQLTNPELFTARGGCGIKTSPKDFARIGWLWLHKGNWDGQQLLPQSYFDSFQQPQVPGDLPLSTLADVDYLGTGPGIYGYNWWFNATVPSTITLTNPDGEITWPAAPADTFEANGHWQKEIMVIIPSMNLVVAGNGNWQKFTPGNTSITTGMNETLYVLAQAVQMGADPTPTPTSTPSETPTPTPTPLDTPTPTIDPSSTPTPTPDLTPTPTPTPDPSLSPTPDPTPTITPTPDPNQGLTLLEDNFDRPDNNSVQTGWVEVEQAGADMGILNNKLYVYDASDINLRPMVKQLFPRTNNGSVVWQFDFDWTRTGAEGTYYIYMQLGDSTKFSDTGLDTGAVVNLLWMNSGIHQSLVYRTAGAFTRITSISGQNRIGVVADFITKTYDVLVNDIQVASDVPFYSDNPIDTVRIFTHKLNEAYFSGRSFDSLSIKVL